MITLLGATRIDQVAPEQIAAYRSARLLDGLALRTINLHITVSRYVYARAVEEGILLEAPWFKRFRNPE